MRIGNLQIPGNLFLAPMAAYTSWPFRRICRSFGAALVTTEVVKARDLVRGIPATLDILRFKPDEHPIAAQIMSADPAEAGEAAARLAAMGFDIVDLNLGCPKRRILSDGMGGALMESPEKIQRIVAEMVRRSTVPVTVKMRAGRFRGKPTALEAALRCQDVGAAAICLHPRPAEGAATAPPDWSLIAQLKRAVSVPVIGNGGIHFAADVVRMFRETGCDAALIGQAAIGRPWIFAQARVLMETGEEPPDPPHEQVLRILLEHYRELIEQHGEKRGTVIMRKQSCHYAKRLRNGKAFNQAVTKISTEADFMAAVRQYLDPQAGTS